jgi:anti-sigma-K factor RskA
MSNINNNTNSSAKRYQNPEVFEQLAIEYAVGSIQGRAKKRFESLMETHFYLRAVVDAYENKFATLVELLPDSQPSDQVWKNIDSHIQVSTSSEKQAEKTPWWQTNFFKQSFGMAAMAVIVSAVLLLNPMTITPEATATAYSAVLESNSSEAMAITKIQKSDMTLSIDIMKKVKIADDMELTLWCHPKDGGIPMKMGTVSKYGKTNIKISKAEWQEMKNVGSLAISVEHKGSNTAMKPTGKILLKGQLSTAGL